MRSKSATVLVTPRQRVLLESITRTKLAPQQLVERCHVVLMSAEGLDNAAQADKLGVDRQRVRRWRKRWAKKSIALDVAEKALDAAEDKGRAEKDFEKLVLRLLDDDPRSGAPPKFSAEQMASIISLACEPPKDSGLPISHWTPPELAREAVKRGIVKSISPRHVDRFLAKRTCDRTKAGTG